MSFTEPEEEENSLFREPPYVDEATRRKRLVPAVLLATPMIIAFVLTFFAGDGMNAWAISGPRLAQGQFETIALHMFAHGGIAHIVFNSMALFAFAPAVMERLGPLHFKSLSAFLALFFGCGLAGMALWLAINPNSEIPMLGASGAIFGLLGFVLRKPDPFGPIIPIVSREMRAALIEWVKLHLPLVAIFIVPVLLGSEFFGLAWEAHLGGFVAGLLLCGPILKWSDNGPDWIPIEEEVV